ncbi:hypothetical protein AAFF_G00071230 [Aldrovandia affinis]|uniref:Ig-like domain-containing protein n=1 Tax=Aldrovandia affinis TaxID=143900 RepID=A0AAD7RZ00_9TELE|nr:hypothetical protein AAFF_G00071230 [Aldrovandia affinis]
MNYCSVKLVIWMTAVIFKTHTQAAVVVIYGQVGTSVILPREKWGGNKVNIHWTIQMKGEYQNVYARTFGRPPTAGEFIKDRVSLDQNGYSLVIKNLIPNDFTTFKCELTDNNNNKVESVYKLYSISVTASPSIILASQTLSLGCDAQRSTVSTQIEWRAPQGKEVEGPSFSAQGPKLTVTNVTAQHHGTWKCTVTYDNRKAEATISVTVVDLSAPSQPLYTFLGSTSPLLLPCSLHSRIDNSQARPKGGHWSFTPFRGDATPGELTGPEKFLSLSQGPLLYWETPQGQKVNGSALEKDHYNFSTVRTAEKGGGVYTCALDFQVNTSKVTLRRTVRVEALRVVSSQENPVLEGQALNLTCTLGHSSLNKLTVKWTAPRLSSVNPLSSPPHSPILSIPRVTEKDRGQWKCQLMEGDKTLVTAQLNLKTERVPVDVWLVVSICGAAVVLILVLVLVFICVQRYRQQRMFVRRRRNIKFCQCKHPQVKGFYKS